MPSAGGAVRHTRDPVTRVSKEKDPVACVGMARVGKPAYPAWPSAVGAVPAHLHQVAAVDAQVAPVLAREQDQKRAERPGHGHAVDGVGDHDLRRAVNPGTSSRATFPPVAWFQRD